MVSSVYTPKGDGAVVSVAVNWATIKCDLARDLALGFSFSFDEAVVANVQMPYIYKGKKYNISEMGLRFDLSKIRLVYIDYTLVIPSGTRKKGRFTIDTRQYSCAANSTYIFQNYGLKLEDYKDRLDGFYIEDITITSIGTTDYDIEQRIKESIQQEEYESHATEGDELMSRGDYDGAIAAYEKARGVKSSGEINNKISKAKNAKKSEELVKEGDALFADEKYSDAHEKYKEASELNPENTDARTKMGTAKNKADAEQPESSDDSDEKQSSGKSSTTSSGSGNSGESTTSSGGESSQTSSKSQQTQYDTQYDEMRKQTEYMERQNAIMEQNAAIASEMGVAALAVHYLLGKLIYSGMGNYNRDDYRAPAPSLSLEFGYSLSTIPIYFNSEVTGYSSTTTKTENEQLYLIDLGANADFWGVYTPSYALGLSMGGYVSHGLIFQSYGIGGQFGLKGHLGGDDFQLYAEYTRGYRGTFSRPWFVPSETGAGDSKYNYDRIGIGPQFRFSSWSRDYRTIRVLGLLERDYEIDPGPIRPVAYHWSKGFRVSYTDRNKFNLFGDVLLNYRRTGEKKYMRVETTPNGVFVRAGFYRRFDFYAPSALSIGSAKRARDKMHKFNAWELSILQPTISWTESATDFRDHRVGKGVLPIGIHKNLPVYGPIALRLGADMTVMSNNYGFGEEAKRVVTIGTQVPVSLRYWIPALLCRYYLDVGRSMQFDFYNNKEDDELPEQEKNYNGWHFGFGITVPDNSGATSAGLRFFQSSKEVDEITRIKPQLLTLTFSREL